MMEPDAMGGGLPFPERKLTKFLIMFDNSNLLYFPGQFLSGRVIVELQDEMAITGAVLNISQDNLMLSFPALIPQLYCHRYLFTQRCLAKFIHPVAAYDFI